VPLHIPFIVIRTYEVENVSTSPAAARWRQEQIRDPNRQTHYPAIHFWNRVAAPAAVAAIGEYASGKPVGGTVTAAPAGTARRDAKSFLPGGRNDPAPLPSDL
jgi:hypothetical protein